MRPYHPDLDTQDTRRRVLKIQNGTLIWDMAQLDPCGAIELALDSLKQEDEQYRDEMIHHLPLLITHAQWTRTRGIYSFHPLLKAALVQTPLDHLLDSVLNDLPEWSVYIKAEEQVGEEWLHGGYVCQVPLADGSSIIFLQTICAAPDNAAQDEQRFISDNLHFLVNPQSPRTLAAHFETLNDHDEHDLNGPEECGMLAWQERIVLYAEYLCFAGPDLSCVGRAQHIPQRQQRAGLVKEWKVGDRFAAAFRRRIEEATQRPAQAQP